MYTDRWFLIGLAMMAGALVVTAILCTVLHRLNEWTDQYRGRHLQQLEDGYTKWRVFLLNVRINSYRAKEKGEAPTPRPFCNVLSFPRLPTI